MAMLNPIEEECEAILCAILDFMGPGKRKISANEHTELMGRVRDAAHHLINKRLGCATGRHSGQCQCGKG